MSLFRTPLLIAALPQCLPAGVVCWFELLRSVWVLVQVPALLIRPLYNVRELLGHLAWYHYTFLEVNFWGAHRRAGKRTGISFQLCHASHLSRNSMSLLILAIPRLFSLNSGKINFPPGSRLWESCLNSPNFHELRMSFLVINYLNVRDLVLGRWFHWWSVCFESMRTWGWIPGGSVTSALRWGWGKIQTGEPVQRTGWPG